MPRTLYLGEDEWSPRNSKIRHIRDVDDELDEDATAGDVIDRVLDVYTARLDD